MNLLRHRVGVQLQTDGTALDTLGLWITPVHNKLTIDGDTHAVALSEDFQVVPVVLLAGLLRQLAVYRQTPCLLPQNVL
jgi:hypothetical protein